MVLTFRKSQIKKNNDFDIFENQGKLFYLIFIFFFVFFFLVGRENFSKLFLFFFIFLFIEKLLHLLAGWLLLSTKIHLLSLSLALTSCSSSCDFFQMQTQDCGLLYQHWIFAQENENKSEKNRGKWIQPREDESSNNSIQKTVLWVTQRESTKRVSRRSSTILL